MAGDWLKIEICTPDKPEVIGIADILGICPAHAFGCLFMVWRWFDQHTTTGNASYVTKVTIDRLSGNVGFADAMAKVGWLIVNDDETVTLPHFDRHNGETAKQRGLTAKRVAKSKAKSNAESNASGNEKVTDDALPREEKRREEKKERDTRATRIPEDWSVTAELGNWALEQNPEWSNEDVLRIGVKFKNHWLSKSGKDARKIDWKATWQNWILNEIDYAKKRQA